MTVQQYINKLKGGMLTITFAGQTGIRSVSEWKKEARLMKMKCEILSTRVIRIIMQEINNAN